MTSIHIPRLVHLPDQTERVEIKEHLPDLETLTPVQGFVEVSHRGNYLEVKGQAETIMTLTCDRCLQQFNHRLSVNASEMIWLEEPIDEALLEPEREVLMEELVESVSPQGYFEPETWLYEQLCLEIPQRKLCDSKCPGIELSDELPEVEEPKVDHRWASLEALKRQMLN
jgi:uncharacterized protein